MVSGVLGTGVLRMSSKDVASKRPSTSTSTGMHTWHQPELTHCSREASSPHGLSPWIEKRQSNSSLAPPARAMESQFSCILKWCFLISDCWWFSSSECSLTCHRSGSQAQESVDVPTSEGLPRAVSGTKPETMLRFLPIQGAEEKNQELAAGETSASFSFAWT